MKATSAPATRKVAFSASCVASNFTALVWFAMPLVGQTSLPTSEATQRNAKFILRILADISTYMAEIGGSPTVG